MLTLSHEELIELTGGYVRTADQFRVLQSRGFHRAAIIKGRIVLERSHYDQVTRGQIEASRPKVKPPRVKAPA